MYWARRNTYINNSFNLAQNCSNRLAYEWNSLEETGLADQDVEQDLVNADELGGVLKLA